MEEVLIRREDTLCVELQYPRSDEATAKRVQVGLTDIRAVDAILIEYDFDRDGWVVKQASVFEWEADDDVCDPGWQEVAFVQAWALDERGAGS